MVKATKNRIAPTPTPPKPFRKRHEIVGITLIGQMPALEHVRKGHAGRVWRVWLSYNDDYSAGVYLELHDDGSIWRYAISEGRITKQDAIKGVD